MEPEVRNPVTNGDQSSWPRDNRVSITVITVPDFLSPVPVPSSSQLFPPTHAQQLPMDHADSNLQELDLPSCGKPSSVQTSSPSPLASSLLPPLLPKVHNEDSIDTAGSDSSGIGSVVGSLSSLEVVDSVGIQMESTRVTDDGISSLPPNDRCESTTATSSSVLPTMETPVGSASKPKGKRGRPSKSKGSSVKLDTASVTTETEETGNPTEEAAPVPTLWPEDATFKIEALVDRCKRKGEYHYFVKWDGYPSNQNSWEPRTSLMEMCHGIVEYYDKMKIKARRRLVVTCKQYDNYVHSRADEEEEKELVVGKPKEPVAEQSLEKRLGVIEPQPLGDGILLEIPTGRVPAKILGVAHHKGDLLYLIQWETDNFAQREGQEDYGEGLSSNNTNVVMASVIKEAFPQLVLQTYEARIVHIAPDDPKTLSEEKAMEEAEKALERKRLRLEEEEKARLKYKPRKRLKKALRFSDQSGLEGDDELLNDEAAQAIARERKMNDMFDPDTSSSDDDEMDEKDGLDILMDDADEMVVD